MALKTTTLQIPILVRQYIYQITSNSQATPNPNPHPYPKKQKQEKKGIAALSLIALSLLLSLRFRAYAARPHLYLIAILQPFGWFDPFFSKS